MAHQSLPSKFYSDPHHILIVDDDPWHCNLVQNILDAPKYALTVVNSGQQALDALQTRRFDAVLLDQQMPGMQGEEVCRRIRGELGLSMLPILMVTGNGEANTLPLSLAAGASDFVRKPYQPSELLARLDGALNHKRLTDQLDSSESMLFALARMVEAKDGTTGDHCSRLAHNGVVLGKALGLGADELMALRRGGVLHDIGKLGIPDSILLKPGKLTDEEWVIMRHHVTIGAQLVGGLKSMRLTIPIILHHHEKWDGSGYPDGLSGEQIPLLARIFQIADIYDALAHARPYKPALEREQVIAVLQEEVARGWRDPALTALFIDIVKTRPDDLAVSLTPQDDLGINLFSAIRNTGALDWDQRTRP